jgi:predicted metalloprotease with PDZ domain
LIYSCRFLLVLALICALAPRARSADGIVKLTVDATDAPRHLIHAKLTFPARPGPLTLLYPKWIPGNHTPSGPIVDVVNLEVTAAGKTIPWRRDLVEMYAFHLDVPPNVSEIEVTFDYTSSSNPNGRTAKASATTELAILNWYQVLLYPQGPPSDDLEYQANLKIPNGWKYGTALPVESESANEIKFRPSSLTTLVDSPVLTGLHFRTIDLSPGETPAHYLHLAGDSERSIEISDEDVAHYRHLVKETFAMFGARHYRSYHFLLALSDYVAHGGLEHHESSDNRVAERTLVDEELDKINAELLPHEMTHSWNGKYRRPAGLATPDYEKPMTGEGLWVYEGLTQYLGNNVLTPRSGLLSPEEYRERLATTAARLDHENGRRWRSVEDTAISVQSLDDARDDYSDYRRTEDYYQESSLIWLEADVLIRQLSHGEKSLDDFCKKFHGAPSGPPEVKPFSFDDVVAGLNSVQPYDWASFLHYRVMVPTPRAPLAGITNSGWKLVYSDVRPAYWAAIEDKQHIFNFNYSLGFRVSDDDGTIIDVLLDSPAGKAGVPPATKLIAVNGKDFTAGRLRDAVVEAKHTAEPIEIEILEGEYHVTYRIDYHGGELFPHLVRDETRPDLLTEISRPHAN